MKLKGISDNGFQRMAGSLPLGPDEDDDPIDPRDLYGDEEPTDVQFQEGEEEYSSFLRDTEKGKLPWKSRGHIAQMMKLDQSVMDQLEEAANGTGSIESAITAVATDFAEGCLEVIVPNLGALSQLVDPNILGAITEELSSILVQRVREFY